jgi:hypothetical protein
MGEISVNEGANCSMIYIEQYIGLEKENCLAQDIIINI